MQDIKREDFGEEFLKKIFEGASRLYYSIL